MAIIKSSYQTRSKGTKRVLASVRYYSYRPGPDLAQRQWYDQDGRALNFDDAREEIRERAEHYGYTYRMTLSTKEVTLTPDDYRTVLGDQFQDYYFVPHLNTEHPHAHVLAFGKKMLSRDELTAMRERLNAQEQERGAQWAQEVQERQEQPHEPALQPDQEKVRRDHGYELE